MSEWPEATIDRLRYLWDLKGAEFMSTAAIGRALGYSKNAVVGKAHRLDLPSRPSPILPRLPPGEGQRDLIKRVAGTTLPPLPSFDSPPPVASAKPARQASAPTRAVAPPTYPLPPARPPEPCCWPLGEPGKPSFRFCDEPTDGSKPYCADHCRLAAREAA